MQSIESILNQIATEAVEDSELYPRVERTCGQCRLLRALSLGDGKYICMARLPIIVAQTVLCRQMLTTLEADASGCELFELKEEQGDG